MQTLYDKINDNAKVLFKSRFDTLTSPIDLNSQEWANWVNCWFEALDKLHEQYHNENLAQTADYLLRWGQDQWNICRTDKADRKYLDNMYARYSSRIPQSY